MHAAFPKSDFDRDSESNMEEGSSGELPVPSTILRLNNLGASASIKLPEEKTLFSPAAKTWPDENDDMTTYLKLFP